MRTIILVVGVLLLAVGQASAAPFSALIDFGDSLSDVGNDYATTLGTLPGGPGYYNGRFSNGPIWVEKLGQSLGLGAPTPSTSGGNDYAYGGVTSGTGYTSVVLPNVETQVNGWTGSHAATPTELFTVLGGANDLLNYLGGTTTPTPAQAADNIAASIHALYTDGARNILVSDLPDLGSTPRFHGTAAQSTATAVSVQFNTELALDLSSLSSTSSGLKIYNLDLFTLIDQAVSNPGKYGLTDVTDQAYTGDTSFAGNGTAVSNPSGYLFWDSIHPTTTGQSLIANAAVAAIPEPCGLGIVIVASASLLRRRHRHISKY